MKRVWSLVRRYGFDALVVVVALESALEVALGQDSSNSPRTTPWFTVPAAALMALPLLARRRFPFAAPAAVWLLAGALSFVDGRLVGFPAGLSVAGLAAAYLLGNLRDARQAWSGFAVTVGSAAIVAYQSPDHATGDLVFIPVLFAIGWLAGFALRERAEQAEAAEARAALAEHERETAARIAVAEERARIARELHDIVAHAVSVMVLQVGAVRHKLPNELADDADALRGVEETGRTALGEMRRLLDAMRRDGDGIDLAPQPGVGSIESLLDEVGRAGLPADLRVEGEPAPLPPAVELSAYRIVQEGLTNALKHGHANHADVTLRYAPDELEIEVHDDGTGNGSGGGGGGYGLVGIRERVKIYGGEMAAGPAPGGGFVLTARLRVGRNAR